MKWTNPLKEKTTKAHSRILDDMNTSVSIFLNVIVRLTFPQTILQIPMNSLVNSSKYFEKLYQFYTNSSRKYNTKEHFPTHFMRTALPLSKN